MVERGDQPNNYSLPFHPFVGKDRHISSHKIAESFRQSILDFLQEFFDISFFSLSHLLLLQLLRCNRDLFLPRKSPGGSTSEIPTHSLFLLSR